MTIIAIDFETANSRRDSACAIGLAWIEGTEIVRREYRLIRPKDMHFAPINISIHGIRPEHVVDAPEFPEVIEEFRADFDGALLIAHNMAFDRSVFGAACESYGLGTQRMETLCTVQMAQRIWPGRPSYKLSVLAEAHGIRFVHHHAGDDAYACAKIAIAGATSVGASDLIEFAETFALRRDHAARPPRPAMAPGGLAERAMASLRIPVGASAAPVSLRVRGSTGTIYQVSRAPGARSTRLTCNCMAGRFRQRCKHADKIARGDFSDVLS